MRRNMRTASQWTPMCLANSLGADCEWSWSISEGSFIQCDPNERLLETCHESADPTYAVVRAGQMTDSRYHRHVASIVPAKVMWSNDYSASSWHACHQAGKPIHQEWKSWLSGTFSPLPSWPLQLPMHTFPSAETRSGIQSAFHQPLLGIGIDTVLTRIKGAVSL